MSTTNPFTKTIDGVLNLYGTNAGNQIADLTTLGATPSNVAQDYEGVKFAGPSSNYNFQQAGNQIIVTDKTTGKIVSTVTTPEAGTQFQFSSGSPLTFTPTRTSTGYQINMGSTPISQYVAPTGGLSSTGTTLTGAKNTVTPTGGLAATSTLTDPTKVTPTGGLSTIGTTTVAPTGSATVTPTGSATVTPAGGLSTASTSAIDNALIEGVKRIYAEDQSLGDLSPYFVNANQATRNEAIRQGLYNLNRGVDYSIIDQARAAKKINPAADTSAFFAKANEATKNAAGQQNLYTWTPAEMSEFIRRGNAFLESGVEFVNEYGMPIQVAPADRAIYLANSTYVGQGPGGVQVRAVALRRSPSSPNPQLVFNPFANQSAALNIDLINQAMDLKRVDGGTPRYYGMNTVDHGYTLSPYGSREIGLDPIASSVLGSRGYAQADQPALKPK